MHPMKKLIAIAAGSLALVAGSAHAGGGCNYGKHQAAMASAEDAVEESAVEDATDPRLLALLKERDAAAEVETVVVPN